MTLHAPPEPGGGDALHERELRHYIRMRRLRGQLFPGHWFTDPVWEILLDMLVLEAQGKPAYLTRIAASVPTTTVLRWTQRLEGAGLIVSRADPEDGRRTILSLSEPCRQGLIQWTHRMFGSSSSLHTGKSGSLP